MFIPPTLASLVADRPDRRPTERREPTYNPLTRKDMPRCPECAAPLSRASACVACPACGWGRCG